MKKKTGSYIQRLLNQLFMIFGQLGSDGGLFVVVGKKKDVCITVFRIKKFIQ